MSHLTMANLGCAQDGDGNLLSPSKIIWYNDTNNVVPIFGDSSASDHLVSPSLFKPTTLDHFFPSGNSTAGFCRSGHTTRPSKRVTDPDNTEACTSVTSSSLKWKITDTSAAHKVAQKHSCMQQGIKDSDNSATNTETEDKMCCCSLCCVRATLQSSFHCS
jgi:hypothetical protein